MSGSNQILRSNRRIHSYSIQMINSISSNWTRSVERNELSNLLLRAIRAIIVVIIVLTSLIRFWNSVFKLNWIEFGRVWLNCIGWLKNKNCNLLLEQIQIKFLQCFWLSIINRLIQLNKVLFFSTKCDQIEFDFKQIYDLNQMSDSKLFSYSVASDFAFETVCN